MGERETEGGNGGGEGERRWGGEEGSVAAAVDNDWSLIPKSGVRLAFRGRVCEGGRGGRAWGGGGHALGVRGGSRQT